MSGVYNLPLTGDTGISGGMPVFTSYGLQGLAYSFTSGSGRIVVPEGVTLISDFFAVGAGGGGGSGRVATSTTTSAAVQSGSGGGGGAYMRLQNVPVVPGEVIYYSIGTGGAGATSASVTSSTTAGTNGNTGTAGGTTSVFVNGTLFALGGGSGGNGGSNSTTAVVSGGAGGTLTQSGSTPSGATLTTASGGTGASAPSASATAAAVDAGTGTNAFTAGLQNTGTTPNRLYSFTSQFLISSTALSLTASGTTATSPSTQSSTFATAFTWTRTALSANEFADYSRQWTINISITGGSFPYEFRMKLQKLNSSGVSYGVDSSYGSTWTLSATPSNVIADTITWNPGTWSTNDQIALVLEGRRPSGTGNKNITVSFNGASLIAAPDPLVFITTVAGGALGSAGFAGGGATGPSAADISTAYAGGNAGLGAAGSNFVLYSLNKSITSTNLDAVGVVGTNTGSGGAGSPPVFGASVVSSITINSAAGGTGADGYLALVFF